MYANCTTTRQYLLFVLAVLLSNSSFDFNSNSWRGTETFTMLSNALKYEKRSNWPNALCIEQQNSINENLPNQNLSYKALFLSRVGIYKLGVFAWHYKSTAFSFKHLFALFIRKKPSAAPKCHPRQFTKIPQLIRPFFRYRYTTHMYTPQSV